MTETQPKNGNGRAGVIALIGGIPVALLAGVVFGAGSMTTRVDELEICARESKGLNAQQEARLMRLETVFERTAEDIREIKAIVTKRP